MSVLRRVPGVYWKVTGLVVSAFVVHAISYRPIVFPLDDAYITLHNAIVLKGFPDLSYAGVPALVGATSIVHTALVTLLTFLFSPTWALEVSLWLAILAYALGLTALARARHMQEWLQIIFVILGLVVAEMPHQLLNGLETGLAVAAVTWALVFAVTERHYALALLCGALPFIRPELVLLSALLLARQGLKRFAKQDKKPAFVGCSRDLLYTLAGAIPWLLLLFINTRLFFPSTVGAKQAFFAEAGLPWDIHWTWCINAIGNFSAEVGLLSLFWVFLAVDSIGLVSALTAAGILLAYYVQFPGALSHNEHRYLYVLLPFVFYAATSIWGLARGYARQAVTFALLLAVLSSTWMARKHWQEHISYCRYRLEQGEGLAQFCNSNLPHGSKLLIHDAGYIAYATKFPLVDFVGLKTPQAIPLHEEMTLPSTGKRRSEAISQLALATRPDYMIVLDDWDAIFHITRGMQRNGWQLQSLRPSEPHPAYQVYRLHPPDSVGGGSAAANSRSPLPQ